MHNYTVRNQGSKLSPNKILKSLLAYIWGKILGESLFSLEFEEW